MEKTSTLSLNTKFYIVLTVAALALVVGTAGLIHSFMNPGISSSSSIPSASQESGSDGQLNTLPGGGTNEVTPDGPAQSGVPQRSTNR